ncbi:hypothetical protein PV11_09568 [Exophiala sideris]|uniref:Uncharacterized protein n=1 Tax=Exophiala sideris TaxID=1016849 RepID=A0A0D1YS62_9EURO|nr:hypothetical protein PV11_09568 [Exophiala sideris]
MIPWNKIASRHPDPDRLIEQDILSEHNLFFYVERGPTQLNRVLDSPMLESAQERRFAISQLGTGNVWFVADHPSRIECALQSISHHFTYYHSDETCRPTSPHQEDLMDFQLSSHPSEALPSLETFDISSPLSQPPSPLIQRAEPTRFPMSVDALINPSTPQLQSRKRKLSDGPVPELTPDESHSPEDLEMLRSPTMVRRSFTYTWSPDSKHDQTIRTRKNIQMRRFRSESRDIGRHDRLGGELAEKHGNLLLDFSRSRWPIRVDG